VIFTQRPDTLVSPEVVGNYDFQMLAGNGVLPPGQLKIVSGTIEGLIHDPSVPELALFFPAALESGVVATPVYRSKLKHKGHPVQDLGVALLAAAGFVPKDRFLVTHVLHKSLLMFVSGQPNYSNTKTFPFGDPRNYYSPRACSDRKHWS
jgi:hypothetical protein